MDSTSLVFDRYRLEERIGIGGMAVVWKATDLQLDQLVALPEQPVTWRSMPQGHVGYAFPAIMVAEDDRGIAVFQPHGTVCKQRTGPRGGPSGRMLLQWDGHHTDRLWTGPDTLRLHILGTGYSIIRAWNPAESCFQGWYVNLEAPWQRTPIGFDSLNHILDITVADDLSSWDWKDEHDYAWARRTHRISSYQADAIARAADQATHAIRNRSWPFNTDWNQWRPDPTWATPTLPDTWRHIWRGLFAAAQDVWSPNGPQQETPSTRPAPHRPGRRSRRRAGVEGGKGYRS